MCVLQTSSPQPQFLHVLKDLSVGAGLASLTVDHLKSEVLFLPLACCVALGKSPMLSQPQFS